MGRLLRLHVLDFKSYKGSQVIGPFHKYTAILGPNGAGKSNLMDAISFVVGVETKQLRGALLKDLVYNADGRRDELKREASVTLIYAPSVGELEGYGENDELRFERIITHTGSCKYKLDGRTVTKQDYDAQLKDIGVLAKARNFLVFQGDVESIASKSPAQLTQFFEEISSSGELIREYNELKEKKDKAATDTIFTYRQKKGISQERKQAKEQKLEAERFNAKREELQNLKTDHFLMQLWQIESDISDCREEIKDYESKVAEVSHEENVSDVHADETKAEEAAARKALVVAEKKVRDSRNKLAKLEPASIKIKEVVNHLERRVNIETEAIVLAKSALEIQAQEKVGLKEDISKMQQAERTLQRQLEQVEKSAKLTPKQMEELESLRENARSQNIALRASMETQQRGYDVAKERLQNLERNIDLLQKQKDDIQTEATSARAREQQMVSAIRLSKENLENTKAKLENRKELFQTLKAERVELENELEKANTILHQAKAYRSESQKERKLNEFLKNLKSQFPGVRGRMIDLCTPSSRRYELAITVALGRQMDSIVVDKESTGFECIRHMRDKRVGKATFLPMDTIEPKRTQERHRLLGPNFKLAIDVLEFDDSLSRVIQYALAGVVICDTLEDARELCFQRKEKVKAVTLDGHVISTNGDMTGGSSQGSRQNRFEQKELDAARRKRDDLRQQLEELDEKILALAGHQAGIPIRRGPSSSLSNRREAQSGGELQSLEVAVSNAENKLKFVRIDLDKVRSKLVKFKEDVEAIEKELARALPQQKTYLETLQNKETALHELEQQNANEENQLIDDYGIKIGVEDIREALEEALHAKNKYKENIAKVKEQQGKLETQLRFVESRNLEETQRRAIKKLNTTKATLEKKRLELEEANAIVNAANEELDVAEQELTSEKQKADEKKLVAREVARAREETLMKKAQLMRELTGTENRLEKLRARRHEVLREAERNQVDIPFMKNTSRRGKTRRESKMEVDEGDLDEEVEDEEQTSGESQTNSPKRRRQGMVPDILSQSSEPSSLGFSNSDSNAVQKDEKVTAKIDFSSLNDQDIENVDRKAVLDSYSSRIHSLEEEMEKMEPNMKADEQFASVTERLRSTDEMLLEARQQAREVEISFDEVKQQRYEKFMAMYEHVSKSIDDVYRELTKSERHPLGGNAYLSIDRTDEPYLGGIKYNAMPPTKRFRDMDQLSGGEKTVAALALLFAVHSFHPAPFFVMDECDAALDAANVHKVSSYLRRHSGDFQCIVISLKDTFYDKADALVGIYREQRDNCSRTLTLDMTPYDDNEESVI